MWAELKNRATATISFPGTAERWSLKQRLTSSSMAAVEVVALVVLDGRALDKTASPDKSTLPVIVELIMVRIAENLTGMCSF